MTDSVIEDLSLTLNRHIAASPEKVYAAWLTPDTLVRFMANCDGMRLAGAQTDPRVGGAFRIDIDNGSSVVPHTGTYLTLQPYSRIAFTWSSPYSTVENSTVTLDLVPDGNGTHLTLTHSRFVDARHRDMHVGGWATMLDGLQRTEL
ncbi:MAG: SRPBCC domain-containing protein [Pseudorhodobacter sp.]|nr:SRPBCC domain-containing protein [Pseudorhodobacter sp.]